MNRKRWWEWLMGRFRKPSGPDPERVGKELAQVEQKIEVTAAAKAQAEQAAEVTGEVETFAPVVEAKTSQLQELELVRVQLLERQREIIQRQHRSYG